MSPAFLLVLLAAAASETADAAVLTFNGYGAVHTGMNRAALDQAGLEVVDYIPPKGVPGGCIETPLRANRAILVMWEDGVVTRVTSRDPATRTRSGVAVGDSEAKVRAVYGNRLSVEPNKYRYEENWRDLTLFSSDGNHAMVFQTDGERVVEIHAGQREAAQYVEGCG
ncbi:hypothetical protein [Tahibacter amnicola]|uniref:Uncharacterized protein n=1 Tax=Tahibacter amnicola TaxID=2976241 RepID=A0ABY6B7H1_9GAMM|nr:hypothetical protein [Tahibacter amnicola]UXI65834.1 hypothetical protein N4264_13785 [Tahibacter amnicola]